MRACQVSRALSDTAHHRGIGSSSYTRFLLTQLDGNVEVIFADLPEVEARGVPAARGGQWTALQVSALLRRGS
jgi:hypothetical protein